MKDLQILLMLLSLRSWIIFTRVSQSKKVLLTIRLAACSFQRFLEVGDAIALQTGTYEFNENWA